jgi:para-aminobenzoate synthetase/4-amino-4-deoxychorismate lyase
VEGVLADNQTTNSAEVSLYEIFKAIFPSGSVTGAPKQRSMQIIQSLEEEERRIYTGAIGFVAPKGQEREVGAEVFFNVPIRTILVRNNQAEMGVGGGITYYSTPEGEWNECQVKTRFLEN